MPKPELELPTVTVSISEDGNNYLVTYPAYPEGFYIEPISRQSTREQVTAFIQHLHPRPCSVTYPEELANEI